MTQKNSQETTLTIDDIVNESMHMADMQHEQLAFLITKTKQFLTNNKAWLADAQAQISIYQYAIQRLEPVLLRLEQKKDAPIPTKKVSPMNGVTYRQQRLTWRASWKNDKGKRQSESFSEKTYGEEGAMKRAMRSRVANHKR
jgi:hypothetical protein